MVLINHVLIRKLSSDQIESVEEVLTRRLVNFGPLLPSGHVRSGSGAAGLTTTSGLAPTPAFVDISFLSSCSIEGCCTFAPVVFFPFFRDLSCSCSAKLPYVVEVSAKLSAKLSYVVVATSITVGLLGE